jgi:hypothetical protein
MSSVYLKHKIRARTSEKLGGGISNLQQVDWVTPVVCPIRSYLTPYALLNYEHAGLGARTHTRMCIQTTYKYTLHTRTNIPAPAHVHVQRA